MSLYAANSIAKGVARYARAGRVRLGGIVCNARKVDFEDEIVSAFAEGIGSRVVGTVPRSPLPQQAELARKTVLELAPESELAQVYRKLAKRIRKNEDFTVPEPMDEEGFELFCDRIGQGAF